MMKILVFIFLTSAVGLRLPHIDHDDDLAGFEISEEENRIFTKEAKEAYEAVEFFEPSEQLMKGWKRQFAAEGPSFARRVDAMEIPKKCLSKLRHHELAHEYCRDPWPETKNCNNAYEIPEYRLGDQFFQYGPAWTAEHHLRFFPESIAAKYVRTKKWKQDYRAMWKVLNGPEYADFEKPAADQMVVHLRLGDVDWTQGDDFYKKMAKEAHKLNLTSVVLVRGEHMFKQQKETFGMNKQQTKTLNQQQNWDRHRTNVIREIFTKAGLTVSERVNHNADCDFIFMVHAPRFIKSGGTFSALINNLRGYQRRALKREEKREAMLAKKAAKKAAKSNESNE